MDQLNAGLVLPIQFRGPANIAFASICIPRNLGGRKISQYLQHPVRQTLQVNMKILLATLIILILCAVGMVPPTGVNLDVMQWTSGHFQSYAFR